MDTNINGKVVIITGGTSGIGEAAAELFLAAGASVSVCDFREDLICEVNDRAKKEGEKLLAVKADITDAQQIKHLFSETIDRFGRIDVLINNAGMGCPDGFLTMSDDLWNKEIELNLCAIVNACELILPYFKEQGSGCIVSTSSLCGRISATVRSVYAVTKACVNVYTKALASEAEEYGIRVNAVAPGMVGTEMVKKNHPDPDDYKSLGKSAMLQRMGETYEIAEGMLFLASDLASGLNGEIIEVTGGKCVVQDPEFSWLNIG